MIIASGLLLASIGTALLGPSTYLDLPQQVWVMSVGMTLIGIAGPLLFIPVLPELISIMVI
jgi:hypothetical protein